MITKAKIIGDNVSYKDYSRQEPGMFRGNPAFIMSRGEIVNFASNPARWLAGYREEQSETDSTKWGSMIDCLLTSPEKFEAMFSVSPETYPDKKTGEAKPWTGAATFCKEWKKEQGDKTIIKSDTKADADKAVAAIRGSDLIAALFAASQKQVFCVAAWKDEATGIEVPLRILLDLVPPSDHPIFGKWLADFKTARNGNPATWARVIEDQSYDIQASLYRDIYCAATAEERVDFVHIVQENVFPFHVVTPPPAMSSEFLDWGRTKYRMALKRYCQCLSTGEWPSFPPVGIPFGNTQIIGPEDCWNYRKCAGMTEFKNPETYAPKPIGDDLGATL
jgi:hypothetical protein